MFYLYLSNDIKVHGSEENILFLDLHWLLLLAWDEKKWLHVTKGMFSLPFHSKKHICETAYIIKHNQNNGICEKSVAIQLPL